MPDALFSARLDIDGMGEGITSDFPMLKSAPQRQLVVSLHNTGAADQ
jgi:hypothetical protein